MGYIKKNDGKVSWFFYWTLDVSRAAYYEIIIVGLSVRLSICSSVSKFWIISFFWYCTWWQLTMTSSDWWSHTFEEIKWWPKFGPNTPKLGSKSNFWHFLKFGSIASFKLHTMEGLQQCPIYNSDKTHKKLLGTKFAPNKPKIRPKN